MKAFPAKPNSRPIWILPAIAGAFYIFGAIAYLLIDGAVGCKASACVVAVNSTLASGTVLPAATSSAAVNIMIYYLQGWGVDFLFFGAILLVVALTGFRQGLRWSYFVLLLFFVYGLVDVITGVDTGPWSFADIILVGVGLALTYGRFFGKANAGSDFPPKESHT